MSPEDRAAFAELVGEEFLPPEDTDAVAAVELAEWLGLTANRVHALGRDGILPRTAEKTYPLRASVAAYCDHARSLAKGKQVDAELAAEKLRLAAANAEKVELANARARGELLDAKRVAAEWANTLTDLRAAVLAIPQRVAGRCTLDRATTQALDEEIRAALEALANEA
jgi:phage terminase Nu1 subunit (DNA packaging protein)